MAAAATVRRAALITAWVLGSAVASAPAIDAAPGGDSDPAVHLGRAFRAYDAGDLATAADELATLDARSLVNRDYYHWLRGQVALLRGQPRAALPWFEALAKDRNSRFAPRAAWRIADCRWELGQRPKAAAAYAALIGKDGAGRHGDIGTARFRIAMAARGARSVAGLRSFLLEHPGHPLTADAEAALLARGGTDAIALSPTDRITRAANLTDANLWHEAIAELALIPADVPADVARRRDYWTGTTLFKMRRRYADAGALLLSVYPQMGSTAAQAMFHGARALSRADRDDEAIVWYRKVVAQYPSSPYAEEAQYLSGWLQFNRGRWQEAIDPLTEMVRRYPRSKWADDARWFLGLAYYFLGRWDDALASFEPLTRFREALEGGKGRYWRARTLQKKGDARAAESGYRGIVATWPFSWYALLARARLAEAGVEIGPFGADAPEPTGPPIAAGPDPALARHPLIAGADELIRAGLGAEAGEELERGEKAFLGKGDRAAGFATLLDAYRRAGNSSRPYMLAVVYGGRALNGPPSGPARVWWEHAYPMAYGELVAKWQKLGNNPDGYLHAIMRKESGFDPHVLSYADARGLLQMIPATTERVAGALGLRYGSGDLYDPEFNVRTGSWYIGHLLAKFKGQIPFGAGSYNSGPRPVMRWLDKHGDRPVDELVELVSYLQTREYMKKVTENYARYRYLYQGETYAQPLVVDRRYQKDELTY
jgi:soluble lytic murein transglycosylase